VVVTKCGHIFGESCLSKIYKSKKKYLCPICHSKLLAKQEIKLYSLEVKALDRSEIVATEKRLQEQIDAKNKVKLFMIYFIINFF
jgi:DNA-directed RNA polymerase subunit RPC12/RpoP